jgi:hypothetical protein
MRLGLILAGCTASLFIGSAQAGEKWEVTEGPLGQTQGIWDVDVAENLATSLSTVTSNGGESRGDYDRGERNDSDDYDHGRGHHNGRKNKSRNAAIPAQNYTG